MFYISSTFVYMFYEGCFKGPKKQKISPQMFRTKIVHASGTFFVKFQKSMSKTILKPCSHIEFNTTNPKTVFKITTYYTKTPKTPKYLIFTKK